MITPRMDREGYFNYVTSTAKKKKISLMQSKLPKLSFGCKARAGAEIRTGKPSPREEVEPPPVSNARHAAVDGRAHMSYRPVPRGPRGPDPWIDHVNNRSTSNNKKDEIEKFNKSNIPLNRSQNENDKQKYNQNKFDDYQVLYVDRYKINQNQPRDDSDSGRYKNVQNNARVNCQRQNSGEYVKGGSHNGNQAALECYSPKYHHIRPQPKGRENLSGQPKYGLVSQNVNYTRRSEQGYLRNGDQIPSAVGGQGFSVRKVVQSEQSQVVVQTHQAPQVGIYSESQFSYRVNGLPGNAAQASAAAAFFAR